MSSLGSRGRIRALHSKAARRCKVPRFRRDWVGSLWIGVLVITVGAADDGRAVWADKSSPTLDDAWFESLVRAESLMSAAASRGQIDSTDRAAVDDQIRIGVDVLGAVVVASVAADTVVAGPLATVVPRQSPARTRGYAILRAT